MVRNPLDHYNGDEEEKFVMNLSSTNERINEALSYITDSYVLWKYGDPRIGCYHSNWNGEYFGEKHV